MHPLKNKILKEINASGPISIERYMEMALFDRKLGYYNKANPIGSKGTFITAPEITQVFGELIGLFMAQYWIDCGQFKPFTLLELGPGKGTLMSDLLRSSRIVPDYLDSCNLCLLEKSHSLKEQQMKNLQDANTVWLDSLEELPDQPVIALANEFFDTLPIRQFVRGKKYWQERLIGKSGDSLQFELSPEFEFKPLEGRLKDTSEGNIVEIRTSALDFIQGILDKIKKYGGIFLIIDYGESQSLGDTFQALEANQYADPLANPGSADLTSHVDFGALVKDIEGISVSPLLGQGKFLQNLGILQRSQILAKNLTGEELEIHQKAIDRLISPHQMGDLFKVMAIYANRQPLPQGLH